MVALCNRADHYIFVIIIVQFVMCQVPVSQILRCGKVITDNVSISFVVNIMFEIAGREVPLALCLHTP